MKKILIAPDKFKGSLTALEVCEAVSKGLESLGQLYTITALPLADGGEGTCELLTRYNGGTFVGVEVRDPLFRMISSGYGISRDGKTAFLEMAKASGLQLLRKHERNPWVTTTAGTGDLIRHALDSGATEIVMGIGGSATNDAGMGMAASLGAVFYNAAGEKLRGTGGDLINVHRIDNSGLHPRLGQTRITIFCDVDNPLHGKHGAAYIFSPQKGAGEMMVEALDDGLKHYEKVLSAAFRKDVNFPGSGAGGGLPATLKAIAAITIRPGMEFVTAFTNLEEKVRVADVVITGEGKLDEQTLSGKVVKGIADLCTKYHKPLIVVAGKNELAEEQLKTLSIARLLTLANGRTTEKEAMDSAGRIIKSRVEEEVVPFLLSMLPH